MAQGPSAGVILLDSSQKPSGVGAGDVGRLFNRFRDNHQVRFALRCGNRLVSEAVLGGDAYAEGYDASALPIGDGHERHQRLPRCRHPLRGQRPRRRRCARSWPTTPTRRRS
jgi:hypothetical protein